MPIRKSKNMVTKVCPTCKQQVPVACKACPCGHVFFTARRPPSKSENDEKGGEVKRRRTERVRRERPDYFNSLQVDNHLKRIHRKGRHRGGNSTSSSTCDNDGDGSNSEENSNVPRKRGRPKGSGNKKKDRPKDKKNVLVRPSEISNSAIMVEKDEDLFSNVSEEKAMQYSVILAEINRKLCAQQFKV